MDLLGAVALIKGDHNLVLIGFHNFKQIVGEKKRFTMFIKYLRRNVEVPAQGEIPIDFVVAALKFVNVLVHTVQDMNYRVHLQHEFTNLGYDQVLHMLTRIDNNDIKAQVQAYYDNMFDVQVLIHDSKARIAAED